MSSSNDRGGERPPRPGRRRPAPSATTLERTSSPRPRPARPRRIACRIDVSCDRSTARRATPAPRDGMRRSFDDGSPPRPPPPASLAAWKPSRAPAQASANIATSAIPSTASESSGGTAARCAARTQARATRAPRRPDSPANCARKRLYMYARAAIAGSAASANSGLRPARSPRRTNPFGCLISLIATPCRADRGGPPPRPPRAPARATGWRAAGDRPCPRSTSRRARPGPRGTRSIAPASHASARS